MTSTFQDGETWETCEDENGDDGFILVQNKKQKRKERIASGSDCKHYENQVTCPYLMSGYCRHGRDGLTPFRNKNMCPYNHPRICSKLLYYGVGGESGCKVNTSGCKSRGVHPNVLYYWRWKEGIESN